MGTSQTDLSADPSRCVPRSFVYFFLVLTKAIKSIHHA